MRNRLSPVEALLSFPRTVDPEERRAVWRQIIAALGSNAQLLGPPPLDGLPPQDIARAVQLALETGLCDTLDWISAGTAAVALYELMSALPQGKERRELGRRVFKRMYEGKAETFAAVATRMALGSGRALEAATVRARVGLVFDLPVATGVNAGALALTLVTRRELLERWVFAPSTGALPARRLAAKLLEHAAREAVTRAGQGDPHARKVLSGDPVRTTFERLLADREPLVWRHAAVARGLLATIEPRLQSEIENALDPGLSPTFWRRAAVSVAAQLAEAPEEAMHHCRGLLAGLLVKKDPGIVATMVWGLPRVIEAEPDAAEALLDRLSTFARADVAEAIAELLNDLVHPSFGSFAEKKLRRLVGRHPDGSNPILNSVVEHALRQFERTSQADDESVHGTLQRALIAYEMMGAREAHHLAVFAAKNAQRSMAELEALDPHRESDVPKLLSLLTDLDSSALERARLSNLLLLGRSPGDTDSSIPEVDRLYDSIGTWVLDIEERGREPEEWTRIQSLGRQRRLRALLHLVDLETVANEADPSLPRMKARSRRVLQVLLRELASVPDGAIHRILCATVARALDAAVREGFAAPSDVLLVVARMLEDQESLAAIAEASTNPEVSWPLAAYNSFVEGSSVTPLDDDGSGTTGLVRMLGGDEQPPEVAMQARAVVHLSQTLAGGSYRDEALRRALLALGRSLEALTAVTSLHALSIRAESGVDPVAGLERACEGLRDLTESAKRRLLGTRGTAAPPPPESDGFSSLVARAASGVPPTRSELQATLAGLVSGLPNPLAAAVSLVANRAASLPLAPASEALAIPLENRRPPLPDWVLPRRTLGAFYVVRALGNGGVSSVFVARRLEERHDRTAEAFALKVPVYDPSTARRLSEPEFMQLFREEAGALLALPHHTNLARFVTFDLAARPKPILVLELIRGVGLDRLLRSRSLTMDRAFRQLDGILAGLGIMHQAGVGHLDIKPSNVILRDDDTPVLVDFGLSGRQVRPGCGTLEYTAPEVLGVVPPGHTLTPAPADMYAFACVAFELLTGETLFEGADEMALMSQHVSHDGWPTKLAAMAHVPGLTELCQVFAACLRRDPRDRPVAAAVRAALALLSPGLEEVKWPLTSGGVAKAS